MIVDTNIIIAYLAGEKIIIETLSNWRKEGGFLYLSSIVEAEILSFPLWSRKDFSLAEAFLEENFVSVPFDRSVARIAAELRRNTKIKLPDAAIAASALFLHAPLITRNIRDFKKIDGLQLISVSN